MNILSKYWHTIRHLQPIQIRYRIYYALKRFFRHNVPLRSSAKPSVQILPAFLDLHNPIKHNTSYIGGNCFRFLNIEHPFTDKINWNLDDHGKLWTYNLNYFDFLLDAAIEPETGVRLITEFIEHYDLLKDGKDPYPTSLRIINWIKFISMHRITNEKITQVIALDLHRLNKNLEYHLMGNHLLENGFALLFGAIYFKDIDKYQKSRKLLLEQLDEQVLADGAHFELSPMYHQIIVSRILSCIDLLKHNQGFETKDLLEVLLAKASLMLGWLTKMCFQNGIVPAVNDTTKGIAPTPEAIFQQANELGIKYTSPALGASGYRKRVTPFYELLADVGHIGPDYIPGHAHSDTLNFLLNIKGQPIIVDTGISTYEKNSLRQAQRATSAHNTVVVNNKEQSDVWDGFRVARRARVSLLADTPEILEASHDGYHHLGLEHQRSFKFSEQQISISDTLTRSVEAKAYLHFHSNVKIRQEDNALHGDFGSITFKGASEISIKPYDLAEGFNVTHPAKMVVISFSQQLITLIQIS